MKKLFLMKDRYCGSLHQEQVFPKYGLHKLVFERWKALLASQNDMYCVFFFGRCSEPNFQPFFKIDAV